MNTYSGYETLKDSIYHNDVMHPPTKVRHQRTLRKPHFCIQQRWQRVSESE